MRARILAVVILLVLIALPLYLYYYFTTQRIASISVSAGSGTIFSVQMAGTFGMDGLPLMDKALLYQKDCIESCTLSPVIPATYTVTLTSSGKTTLTDTIAIDSGEKIIKSYGFSADVTFVPI